MCNFFSAMVFTTGAIRFCEDDSHEVNIQRLGLRDHAPPFMRGWVRVEAAPVDGTFPTVRVDESSTPGWYDEGRERMDEAVRDVALRVWPAWQAYNAACTAAQQAYNAACAPAWQAYNAACVPAQQAHDAAWSTAGQAYGQAYSAACATAWQAYHATCGPAGQVYDAACVPAQQAHDAACVTARRAYVTAIRSIEGFVPERASDV